MKIKRLTANLSFAISALVLIPFSAHGQLISPTDLNAYPLGENIIGPVGSTVDASFVNSLGESLGDIRGGVACPEGFVTCVPADNPAGTIYTYVYEIAPGVDAFPNDTPFPQPPLASPPFDKTTVFQLDFSPGSNGIAGFDFTQADNSLGANANFQIELLDDTLTWTVSGGDSDWNTGEVITFFWQTTQPPAGPGKVYEISNGNDTGGAIGPNPAAVPAPGPLPLLALASLAWIRHRRKASNQAHPA